MHTIHTVHRIHNAHSVYQIGAVVIFSSALPAAYCVQCIAVTDQYLTQNAFNVFTAPIYMYFF